MRIGISGAQCTGKTTLLKAISTDPDFKIPVLKEIVRSLMASGVKINREADHVSQMTILEKHYKNALTYDNFFSDRCSLDAFVYAIHGYINGKFTLREHWEHELLFTKTLPYYNHIFLLSPLGFVEKDGVRDADTLYQGEIHDLFIMVCKNYKIKSTHLTGTIDERLLKIKKYLYGA